MYDVLEALAYARKMASFPLHILCTSISLCSNCRTDLQKLSIRNSLWGQTEVPCQLCSLHMDTPHCMTWRTKIIQLLYGVQHVCSAVPGKADIKCRLFVFDLKECTEQCWGLTTQTEHEKPGCGGAAGKMYTRWFTSHSASPKHCLQLHKMGRIIKANFIRG